MARRDKREHLNDFKVNEAGKYEYQGKCYVFGGSDADKKSAYMALWVLAVLTAGFCILSGCISGAGITNTFYVILPYLLEVCALFALLWNHVRLFSQKHEIRAYIYKSAHPKLAPAAMLTAFFAIAGFLMSLVFSITTGFRDGVVKAVLYLVLKAAAAATALLYRARFQKTEWIEI